MEVSLLPTHSCRLSLESFSAIKAALSARKQWAAFSFVERATIFLKAADLIAGKYRAKINAATMLSQGKNCFQAEVDASCELIDFLRFNAYFAQEIQLVQPESADGIWNRTLIGPDTMSRANTAQQIVSSSG